MSDLPEAYVETVRNNTAPAMEEQIARAVLAERERCAKVAVQKGEHVYDDCECLGSQDPETGLRECSLEAKGHDCLCDVAAQMASEIATKIGKGE